MSPLPRWGEGQGEGECASLPAMNSTAASDAPATPALAGSSAVTTELFETVKLALPIVLAQAGQAAMGLVDTAVVGRFNATAQAAVGLSNGLFFFFACLGMGTMLGLDPLISQAFGAKDEARASRLLWQG